jgi:four helix bundle protein
VLAYEKFHAWEAAHELALQVYATSDCWPSSERYQLTAQVRRAALSVPTNIAEGAAKRGRREFRRYLDIANGSLAELAYLLRFGKDRGLIDQEIFDSLNAHRDRAGKLTWTLYASLARNKAIGPTDRLTD